jgi:peptidoglycan/xylan/chitin deacetylase (PgdA/CDA1 family)
MTWIKKNSRKFGKMTTTPNRLAVLMLAVLISAACIPPINAFAESSVSVLCYHSFHDRKKMDPFCFTLDELSSHISQLEKEGFKFVSVKDVVYGRITGTKNVLITVDDGNRSVYEAYQKVFRPHGIRPLLAIYPNIIIHKKTYALTWEQLAELANSGCDIAAHGYFHLKINKKLYDKNPDYFKKEIFLSKKVLEEKLNRKIFIFVYPFGLRDDMTIKALKEAGYQYAFTIDKGKINEPVAIGGDKVFELPRYMVTRTSWKYCFNRVMKNARPKVAYKVAAAFQPEMDKAVPIEQKRPDAELYGPYFGFQNKKISGIIDVASSANEKHDKNEKQPAPSSLKKKRDDFANIFSSADQEPGLDDMPVLKHPMRDIFWQNDGTTMTAHIQKDPSGIRHDLLVPEGSARHSLPVNRNPEIVASSPLQLRRGDIDGSKILESGGAILTGKIEQRGGGYCSKIKSTYHSMNMHSYNTYHNFLGLVKEKVDRIKHSIRKYAISNF